MHLLTFLIFLYNVDNIKKYIGYESSKYKGLSHEQLCIVTATDRNGHEINSYVGNGKPTTTSSINQSLANKITNKSILYTDGAFCYNQLANINESSLVQLYDHQMYNQVDHLNTVNYIIH